MIITTYEE
ncbi:unnamed protein product, partial [Rotaria magnacalcarata]